MFGSVGLKVHGKVFAMVVNGALVVKLPAPRAGALIQSGQCTAFDPGHGRPMKEWVSVSEGGATLPKTLIEESLAYVVEIERRSSK